MSDSGTYLRSAGVGIETAIVEELPESGIEVADRYASSLLAELNRVAPEVDQIVGDTFDLDGKSEQERRDIVRRVIDTLESVAPEGPDPHVLARQNREFAPVYDLAPRCLPLAPPPSKPSPRNVPKSEAADGTDLDACYEGTCEVAIAGTYDVRVGSFVVVVLVADEVRIVDRDDISRASGAIITDVGSTSRIAAGDETLAVTLTGLHEDTAVLKFDVS
jgi:hypothetical protein